MLESTLEDKFRKKVKALGHGIMCLKFVSPGFTGVPDRIILLPGARVVFVELKQPKKKEDPRKRQTYVQGLLRKLGFPVFSTVNTPEKIEAVVAYCEEVLKSESSVDL